MNQVPENLTATRPASLFAAMRALLARDLGYVARDADEMLIVGTAEVKRMLHGLIETVRRS